MLYPFFILFMAALLTFLLLLKVNIVLEYVRNDKDDNISISFFALGKLLKYKIEIPLIDVGSQGAKYKVVRERGKKDTQTGEKKEKTSPFEFLQKIRHIYSMYHSNNPIIDRIRCRLKKSVVFDEFKLDVTEGTGDAGSTGIVNGLLWALSGFVVSLFSSLFRIKSRQFDSRINIKANYDRKVFNVDLFCIFHVKLVYIIVILAAVNFKKSEFNNTKKETGGDISG